MLQLAFEVRAVALAWWHTRDDMIDQMDLCEFEFAWKSSQGSALILDCTSLLDLLVA